MKIGFVIYNNMTALDFIGVFDPLTRLKTMQFMTDVSWEICAYTEEVVDIAGLRFTPEKVGQSLGRYEMLVVPGGFGSRKLIKDGGFLNWIKTAVRCPLKVSVCTGSLILGAAGFLEGKAATTHPGAYAELRDFCQVVREERVVDSGDVITARGVTSSIDLGLYLCEKLVGREAREEIRRQMDYQG